jgi:hypothetical protein
MAESLRRLMMQYLGSPNLEAVPISAMLPDQAVAEAKQQNCEYVLYSTFSEKAKDSASGLFKRALPMMAMVPGVGAVAQLGRAVTTADAISSQMKPGTELTLSYQLVRSADQSQAAADTKKSKAKNSGADSITPLVSEVDAAVLASIPH